MMTTKTRDITPDVNKQMRVSRIRHTTREIRKTITRINREEMSKTKINITEIRVNQWE